MYSCSTAIIFDFWDVDTMTWHHEFTIPTLNTKKSYPGAVVKQVHVSTDSTGAGSSGPSVLNIAIHTVYLSFLMDWHSLCWQKKIAFQYCLHTSMKHLLLHTWKYDEASRLFLKGSPSCLLYSTTVLHGDKYSYETCRSENQSISTGENIQYW